MVDVLALGDVNVDVIADYDAFPPPGGDALASSAGLHCGGSAANLARILAWLGTKTALIGRVGTDPLADMAVRRLEEAGVVLTGLQCDPAAMTGCMYIVVTPGGERTILGYRGANAFIDPGQVREEEFSRARLLHLSGYALLAEPARSAARRAFDLAVEHGLTISLDPGMSGSHPAMAQIEAWYPWIDILLPNLAEAQALTGCISPEECARAFLRQGVRLVALKLGSEGCLVASAPGLLRVPGFPAVVQDSTGAGDGFAAGFLAAVAGGLDRYDAAVLGNAVGALVAGWVGADGTMEVAGDLLPLLREAADRAEPSEHCTAIRQVVRFLEQRFSALEE